MFEHFFRGVPARGDMNGGPDGDWRWGMDLQETDDEVIVRAEAPGFDVSDFDIEVRGDQICLSAERKSEDEESERGYREWSSRSMCRTVTLPAEVDGDRAEAKYVNGVLTLTLPKTAPSRGRRIPVQEG